MTTNHAHHHGGSMIRSTITRGALALGAAGAVSALLIVAAPNASAHAPYVKLTTSCADLTGDGWKVHAVVGNDTGFGPAVVKSLSRAVSPDPTGTTLADAARAPEATFIVPAGDASASLTATLHWTADGFEAPATDSVDRPAGCTTPTPTPTTPAPTTPAPTTPAPTTPAPTTPAPLPPADGSEAHDCHSITVSAADARAQVVVSIGDQDRTLILTNGKGRLTFPPHTAPLNVVVTVTAPGRAATVIRVVIPTCIPGTIPPGKPTPTPSPTASVPVPVPSPTVSTPAPKPSPTVAKPKPTTATPTKPAPKPAAVRTPARQVPTPAPVVVSPAAHIRALPNTGTSNLVPIIGLGLALLVAGAVLAYTFRKRVTR